MRPVPKGPRTVLQVRKAAGSRAGLWTALPAFRNGQRGQSQEQCLSARHHLDKFCRFDQWPVSRISWSTETLYLFVSLSCRLYLIYFNPLKPSGHYTYHQFNIHKFYVLPTQCIYVFCMDLRKNSDYFPIHH